MKILKLKVALLTLLIVSLYGSMSVTADEPSGSCPPLPEALEAMESDSAVTVRTVEVEEWEEGSNFYYAFEPNGADPKIGFIIYPGGSVDPRAYAPPAHTIAGEGYLTVIVKMPDDLAVYGNKRANEVITDYGEIEKWVIGGHSLGGSMACAYAKKFTDKVEGVVIWAAYPTETFRIDDKDLKAISIYGTKNLNIENFEASAEHLPPDTPFVIIEGGNHSQFGWYDTSLCPEGMDRTPADITIEEQQAQILQATLDFLGLFDTTTTTTTATLTSTTTIGSTTTVIPPLCTVEEIYGQYSEETELLRYLRDDILSATPEGQEIIRLYYGLSPVVARTMEGDAEFEAEIKEMIDGILQLVVKEME